MTTHRLLLLLASAAFVVSCSSSTSPSDSVPEPTSTTSVAHTTTSVTDEPGETTTTTDPCEGDGAGCEQTTTTSTLPLDELVLAAEQVADGFDKPVFLHADPDGGSDLVVEQTGRIVRLDQSRMVVLDLTAEVTYGGERGLLGLAFHPDFDGNRLGYVNYIDRTGSTVIAEYVVRADGTFDPDSARVLLTIGQPAGNHNGGMIAFGPDRYLWIGMGDGGGADDRYGNGQRADTLLGSMLRIEVGPDIGTYRIPEGNPGGDFAPEVWWIGLRNPWRFSFDASDVYVADVGQRDIEEITVVPASESGANLGWPVMEGSTCFQSSGCDANGLVTPQVEYDHSQGCSVTGGYVYRGNAIPEIGGHYFFSDYCSGFLRSWEIGGDVHDWTAQVGSLGNVSSFGVGGDGELYIITLSGTIYRLERVP